MKLIFSSKKKQEIYEYLYKNKIDNRIQITYRTAAKEIGCTAPHVRKIVQQLQEEGYLKVLISGNGTLLEIYEPAEFEQQENILQG